MKLKQDRGGGRWRADCAARGGFSYPTYPINLLHFGTFPNRKYEKVLKMTRCSVKVWQRIKSYLLYRRIAILSFSAFLLISYRKINGFTDVNSNR